MKAQRQLVLSSFTLFCLTTLSAFVGCQQPYSYGPYGPYPQDPYAQPPYGQPLPPGSSIAPGGTVAPGSGTSGYNPGSSIPPISSVPPGQVKQPDSGSGNNAPPFNPSNPGSSGNGQSVPDPADEPSSPYFEKSSSLEPNGTFVPATASNAVSQAGFTQTAARTGPVTVTSGEKPGQFEPPIRSGKQSGTSTTPTSPADPFEKARPLQHVDSEIPLAPPLGDRKESSTGDSLEGTVRKVSEKEWMVEFASSSDPFGGKLRLTGTPEVLRVLRDGKRYRLKGYIESSATNPAQSQFHIEQVQPLGISVTPTK